MRELIGKIFKNNNFDLIIGFDNIDFYNNKDYTSFYLVNYIDLTKVSNDKYFEKLNELESRCVGRYNQDSLKKLLYDRIEDDDDKKALDKNLSAVYVIEVDDSKKFYDNRNLIYDIEESPYFFKRYILAYTKNQVNDLVDKMSKNGISLDRINDDDLSKLVDNFDEYKKLMNNKGDGYYELLVRLFCKLPFLNFTTSNEISIDSLDKKIEEEIKEEGLSPIYDRLLEEIYRQVDCESEEDKNEEAELKKDKLIESLLESLNEEEDSCIDKDDKDSFIEKELREFLGE